MTLFFELREIRRAARRNNFQHYFPNVDIELINADHFCLVGRGNDKFEQGVYFEPIRSTSQSKKLFVAGGSVIVQMLLRVESHFFRLSGYSTQPISDVWCAVSFLRRARFDGCTALGKHCNCESGVFDTTIWCSVLSFDFDAQVDGNSTELQNSSVKTDMLK